MNKEERLDRRYSLAYRADYSSRYHRRRASFLNAVDKAANLFVIVAGTSAFVSLVGTENVLLPKVAAVAVTIVTIAQVILGIGASGARHEEWMRRWDRMANEIRASPNPTASELQAWDNARASIEGECVSELRALTISCENDARAFLGTQEGIRKVNRLQRFCIQLGTFQNEFELLEPAPLPPQLPSES